MSRRTRITLATGIAALLMPLAACGTAGTPAATEPAGGDNSASQPKGNDGEFIFVVKLSGTDWFNRMDVLSKEYAAENGMQVKQLAADDASEEKQISIISDVIPQKPAALLVVLNSPQSVEATLKRAQDAGITVITHEAAGVSNTDPPSRRLRTPLTVHTRWTSFPSAWAEKASTPSSSVRSP